MRNENVVLKTAFEEKDLGVTSTVDELKFDSHTAGQVSKINKVLGLIRSFDNIDMKISFMFLCKSCVRH